MKICNLKILPDSLIKSLELLHKDGELNCNLCREAENLHGIYVSDMYDSIPWLKLYNVPICMWSMGSKLDALYGEALEDGKKSVNNMIGRNGRTNLCLDKLVDISTMLNMSRKRESLMCDPFGQELMERYGLNVM